jgi:hypothetical protein
METNAALATATAILTHVGLMVIERLTEQHYVVRNAERVAHETPIVPSVNAQTHAA